jgi:hypothetical protein
MEVLTMPGNITPLRARSCTPDPYLLNTARLHRVDASLLPKGTGVSLGHCRTDLPEGCTGDCEQGRRCTCTPARTATPHTEPPVPESVRDHTLRAWFWRGYIALLLAVLASVVWPWLVH